MKRCCNFKLLEKKCIEYKVKDQKEQEKQEKSYQKNKKKRFFYSSLLEWKKNSIKTPLMIIGARQIRKTYIIKEFCQKEFEKNICYVFNKVKSLSYGRLF